MPQVVPLPGESTVDVYLPYIAKTLGGSDGWETPFIIQNTDAVPTELELLFYRITDGVLAATRMVRELKPGTSYADRPNQDQDLADDMAYSLVVRSFGAKVVAVVNEQRGVGDRFEADTYVSEVGGLESVFLPRVSRGAGGFESLVIVQNAGRESTEAAAAFLRSDGSLAATVRRILLPGRAAIIDLAREDGLSDGDYAVRLSASQRLVAIANNHRDKPSEPRPMFYSYKAILDGANTVYGPYAAKGVPGVGGGTSTITVLNMGSQATQATLHFTRLGGGAQAAFEGPRLAPGGAWLFDLAFPNGDTRQSPCAREPAQGCLPDGEFSLSAAALGGQLAALVTIVGPSSAAAYSAVSRARDAFLPNVTRTLGGRQGWTTPIVIQSITAQRLTLLWYRFADGALAATQRLTITPGVAIRVDPRAVAELADNAQYAVVVDSDVGGVAAVVIELNFEGGDGAAVYAGFFR